MVFLCHCVSVISQSCRSSFRTYVRTISYLSSIMWVIGVIFSLMVAFMFFLYFFCFPFDFVPSFLLRSFCFMFNYLITSFLLHMLFTGEVIFEELPLNSFLAKNVDLIALKSLLAAFVDSMIFSILYGPQVLVSIHLPQLYFFGINLMFFSWFRNHHCLCFTDLYFNSSSSICVL